MEITPKSTQPNSNSATSTALSNVQRPGQYLRQTRQAQQLELSDIASELNISIKTLKALEDDAYTSLPEVAFIKGYYRSYAKYLKVDASSIIQRFDEIYANDTGVLPNYALNNSPIKMMGKLASTTAANKRKWLKRAFIIVVILALIGLAIAVASNWMQGGNSGGVSKVQQPVVANSDVEVLPLDGVNNPAGDALAIGFSKASYVRIVDSTGKVLVKGRQEKPVTVYGQTPFQIRLDDPAAVTLTLNQEPISLSPYMGKGVAEFRLSH